ncbi:MAG: hypothetical protein M4579_006822 [Chaenotheca gracillima]|nr:MAG: hypothetical protein M4579_006822 [Chaenotheca gracillima]
MPLALPSSAIRFIPTSTAAASTKSKSSMRQGTLHLSCHVTPNAATIREGITSITSEQVEVCVSAAPREGEANKAVKELIAQILGVPKSNVAVTKGLKSRDKTVVVSDYASTSASSSSSSSSSSSAVVNGSSSEGKAAAKRTVLKGKKGKKADESVVAEDPGEQEAEEEVRRLLLGEEDSGS